MDKFDNISDYYELYKSAIARIASKSNAKTNPYDEKGLLKPEFRITSEEKHALMLYGMPIKDEDQIPENPDIYKINESGERASFEEDPKIR